MDLDNFQVGNIAVYFTTYRGIQERKYQEKDLIIKIASTFGKSNKFTQLKKSYETE